LVLIFLGTRYEKNVKTLVANAFSSQTGLIIIIMTIARKQNARVFVMRSDVNDGGIKRNGMMWTFLLLRSNGFRATAKKAKRNLPVKTRKR